MNGKRPNLEELYQIGKMLPAFADPLPPELSSRPPSSPPQLLGPYLPTDNTYNRSHNASTVPEIIPVQQITKPVPVQVTLPQQPMASNQQFIQLLQNTLQALTTNATTPNTMFSSILGFNGYINPYLGGLHTNTVMGQPNSSLFGLNSAFNIVPGGQAHLRPPNVIPTTTTTSVSANMLIQSSCGSAFVPPNSNSSYFQTMRNNETPYYPLNGVIPITTQAIKADNNETSLQKSSAAQPSLQKVNFGNRAVITSSDINKIINREPKTSNGFTNYEGPWCVPNAMTYHESVIKEEFARNNDCVTINIKPNTDTKLSNNVGNLIFPGVPQIQNFSSNNELCATPIKNSGDTLMMNLELSLKMNKETPVPARIGSSPVVTEAAVRYDLLENPIFTTPPEPIRMVTPYFGNVNPVIAKFVDVAPAISAFDFKAQVVRSATAVALYGQQFSDYLENSVTDVFYQNGISPLSDEESNRNKRKANEELEEPNKKAFREDSNL